MKITDVRIRKVLRNNNLKGVASITFDDMFAIHDIKIIEGEKGMFIAMPSRQTEDGNYRDICHPINTETRAEIQEAVFKAYNEAV